MSEKVRVSINITPELEQQMSDIAEKLGTTKTEVVRRGLRLMQLVQSVQSAGLHIGYVKERSKLDTEIVGLW